MQLLEERPLGDSATRHRLVQSFSTIREPLAVSLCLLLLGLVTGLLFPMEGAVPVDGVENVYQSTTPTVVGFAVNNLKVAALMMAGIVTFGAPTVLALLFNGLLLGLVVKAALRSGADAVSVSAVLLPHAVPELLGLAIAGAIGLWGPLRFWRYLNRTRDQIATRRELKDIGTQVGVSVTLIVLAAGIESVGAL